MATGVGIRITVWNEYEHERNEERIGKVYPNGIHGAIIENLKKQGFANVRGATLDMPEHGLTEEVLNETDVLFWWGHMAHHKVADEIVERVYQRVMDGMGLVVLHSGHDSKIFNKLMGTTSGKLRWREANEKERIWVIEPGHPIADGLPEYFELPHEEMYGERFNIPAPDQLVMISWFEGGEVFRSGCCYYRGRGKIFYFRPGHEVFPTFYRDDIGRVLANAAKWAAPVEMPPYTSGHTPNALEEIRSKVD